ncbi:hypothetical protein K0M31_010111 [Melipona bicolor]|uniref:Uncharacterized protein n=1 Tax=Melipona bicolor TaxID=60889 RepID=A0AA40FM94_9HYME|nr:hypothetical protein K0M31_010111 [Melipona bicolor]
MQQDLAKKNWEGRGNVESLKKISEMEDQNKTIKIVKRGWWKKSSERKREEEESWLERREEK